MYIRRKMISETLLSMALLLLGGCGVQGSYRLRAMTRVLEIDSEGIIHAYTTKKTDVLVHGVPVPTQSRERTLPEENSSEGNAEEEKGDGEKTRQGAVLTPTTRVWENEEHKRRELIQWISDLNIPWTWFVTMTFRNPNATALGATSALKLWLRGWRKHNPGAFRYVMWSVEPQQRGTAHIHALMAGSQLNSREHCTHCLAESSKGADWQRIKESWGKHHGWCRCYPYDNNIGNGGISYVCKYVLSDECEEWGLWSPEDWS